MNLQPLKITTGDAGKKIQLTCKVTKEKTHWNDAALRGWKVDIEGKPFSQSSYYSPAMIENMTNN
jgi:hypothetical protein